MPGEREQGLVSSHFSRGGMMGVASSAAGQQVRFTRHPNMQGIAAAAPMIDNLEE